MSRKHHRSRAVQCQTYSRQRGVNRRTRSGQTRAVERRLADSEYLWAGGEVSFLLTFPVLIGEHVYQVTSDGILGLLEPGRLVLRQNLTCGLKA